MTVICSTIWEKYATIRQFLYSEEEYNINVLGVLSVIIFSVIDVQRTYSEIFFFK
jgi:hypothetical protein